MLELAAKQWKLVLAFSAIAVLVLTSLIAFFILLRFPNSGDEYTFLYQAQTLAAGRLWNMAHRFQAMFNFYWVVEFKDRIFGQYPIGWPGIIFLMRLVGIPAWLLNPILASLTVPFLFMVFRRLSNAKIALATLLIYITTSFFLFNSSSYFSHTPFLLCTVLCLWASLLFIDQKQGLYSLLAGFFGGVGFIIRPYSALLLAVVLVAVVTQKKAWKETGFWWVLAGVFPPLALQGIVNYAMFGNPFTLPSFLINSNEFGVMFPFSFSHLIMYLFEIEIWGPPFMLLAYLFYLYRASEEEYGPVYWLMLVVMAGYFFYTTLAGNRYGPRYFYFAYPFALLFVVKQMFRETGFSLKSQIDKLWFGVFGVTVILGLATIPYHLINERLVVWERLDFYRTIQASGLKNALVFVNSWVGNLRPMNPIDYARNALDFDNSVLVALPLEGEDIAGLVDYYPQRSIYNYYYNKATKSGYLKLIRPAIKAEVDKDS